MRKVEPLNQLNLQDLSGRLSAAMATPGQETSIGRWVNDRIVAVLGTPTDGSTSDFAFGLSAVPPGVETPRHSHRAEELAVVLSGAGEIEIGHQVHPVREGDILRTPPGVEHLTRAGLDEPLQVLWIYAPAGSEERWLSPTPDER